MSEIETKYLKVAEENNSLRDQLTEHTAEMFVAQKSALQDIINRMEKALEEDIIAMSSTQSDLYHENKALRAQIQRGENEIADADRAIAVLRLRIADLEAVKPLSNCKVKE